MCDIAFEAWGNMDPMKQFEMYKWIYAWNYGEFIVNMSHKDGFFRNTVPANIGRVEDVIEAKNVVPQCKDVI